MKLFRCSSLHKLVGESKSKGSVLSDTAKTEVRTTVKEDLTTFKSFKGNQYTAKGKCS